MIVGKFSIQSLLQPCKLLVPQRCPSHHYKYILGSLVLPGYCASISLIILLLPLNHIGVKHSFSPPQSFNGHQHEHIKWNEKGGKADKVWPDNIEFHYQRQRWWKVGQYSYWQVWQPNYQVRSLADICLEICFLYIQRRAQSPIT